MLSERGLALVEKLIESNHTPITSRVLAQDLGVSERSVKTYIKEVADYFEKNGIEFHRKPGKGFTAKFSEQQILELNQLLAGKKTQMSQKQRLNYIIYILLSGWDTYTLSLFSEELNVSKNVITEDINIVEKELEHYNIKINRQAGLGISATGDEFDIRKALRHCCEFPIGNKIITKEYDHRISVEESALYINNFSQINYEEAIEILHIVEKNCQIIYTDYSLELLSRYLTIQLSRLRMGKQIKEDILDTDVFFDARVAMIIIGQIEKRLNIHLENAERQYVQILLASATLQNVKEVKTKPHIEDLSIEILEYLSEILCVELTDNKHLISSMKSFLEPSFIRTKYGIEVENPFLKDIAEMYSGIFATCFMTTRFYEIETGKIPSDHEIAFIALQVGGALHRMPRSIKAILIGTGGLSAANITAIKIENRIPDIEIVAILSSEKISKIEEYDCDLVLSTLNYRGDNEKIIKISPIISSKDEKKIRNKCFEILSDKKMQSGIFTDLIDEDHILFIEKPTNKEEIIKEVCEILYKEGYVTGEYIGDVLYREKVEATAIGNGIAIPHGKPEHVIKPKIFVIRLKKAIEWADRKVNIIFLLALHFDNMTTTKAFFYDFTRILSTEENINRIKEATDSKHLEKIIKQELHWD